MKDREIDEILKQAAQAPHDVDPALLDRVASSIGSSMRPVRPLPPAWVLAGGLVLICAAVALAGAARSGFYGIQKLSVLERVLIFPDAGHPHLAGGNDMRQRNDPRKPASRGPGVAAGSRQPGAACRLCGPVPRLPDRPLRVSRARLPDCRAAPRDSRCPCELVASTARVCSEFRCRRTGGGHTCGSGRSDHAGASLRESPGPARDALAHRSDTGKRGRGSARSVGASLLGRGWRSRAGRRITHFTDGQMFGCPLP